MIDILLQQVAAFIAQLAQMVANSASSLFQTVTTWMQTFIGNMLNAFNSIFSSITNWLQGVIAQVYNLTSYYIGQIAGYIQNAINYVYRIASDTINGIAFVVNNTVAKINAVLQSVIDTVRGWINSAFDQIRRLIDAGVASIQGLVSTVTNTVTGWINKALQFILDSFNLVAAKIKQGIDAIVGSAASLVNTIGQRVVDLRAAFLESAEKIVQQMAKISDTAVLPLSKQIKESMTFFVDIMPVSVTQSLLAKMQPLVRGQVGLPAYRQFIGDVLFDIGKANPGVAAVFSLLVLYSGLNHTIGKLADVYTKPIVQEIAAAAPYEVMSPIDIAAAWRRGFVEQSRAIEVIRRQGFTVDDAQVILKLADTVPAEFELVAMELRGIISPAETEQALRVRGFDAGWAAKIRAMGQVIPPVADLITMAVREAFSPDIAARFGQYEGFPQDLATWAQKQGLSPEWARRYWAAHWSLPSATQGFEMFQRRIISKDDLQLLLRALDVMPFWRERLIELSYNPLTRVDIRRMHNLGILNEQAVYDAHLDIGYSPENAERLTDFVVKLNKGNQPVDDDELGRLNRTTVLNFYRDGLITQEKALQYLTGMGIPSDAAILYVRSVDADEQLAIRKADADFIVEQAQAGVLTFAEAQDRLNSMGLEPLEVKRATNKLVRLLDTRTKLPSRTEGERMFKLNIIGEGTYRELLARLQYADVWIEAYVKLAKGD
jgi:hypothetical protein